MPFALLTIYVLLQYLEQTLSLQLLLHACENPSVQAEHPSGDNEVPPVEGRGHHPLSRLNEQVVPAAAASLSHVKRGSLHVVVVPVN